MHSDSTSRLPGRSAPYRGILLWTLTLAFAARVLGQAVQFWAPQTFLPVFEEFQGSALPYWLLLTIQILMLALMARMSGRVQSGRLVPSHRMGKALAWAGGLYLTGSLARIGVGLAVAGAPAWFRAWIPAVFHLVLAGFVLTLASCHLRGTRHPGGEARS